MEKDKKYEYQILRLDLCSNSFDEDDYINLMGKEGWKLVSVVAKTNGKPIIYFRRRIK